MQPMCLSDTRQNPETASTSEQQGLEERTENWVVWGSNSNASVYGYKHWE